MLFLIFVEAIKKQIKKKFEDFCQNFTEKVDFLISHCFEGRDFIIFVSFDKADFGNEVKRFIAIFVKKDQWS